MRSVQGARGQVDVPAPDGAVDLVDPDLFCGELLWIDLYPDGVFRRAPDHDLSHAADHGDALGQHGLGVFVQVIKRKRRRGQSQHHDRRIGGVGFAEGRRRRHAGGKQRHGFTDRGLDIHGGAVDVAAQIKLQSDLGGSHRIRRNHGIQSRNPCELPFQQRGHGRRHGVGIGAGKVGENRDGREIDGRHVAHRKSAVRDDTEQGNGEHQQACSNRAPDEDRGDVHFESPARRC